MDNFMQKSGSSKSKLKGSELINQVKSLVDDLVKKDLCTGGALMLLESNSGLIALGSGLKLIGPEDLAKALFSTLNLTSGFMFAEKFAQTMSELSEDFEFKSDDYLQMNFNASNEIH